MLLKEKKRLESILEMTRNQLIDAPGGTLQISKTGKWVQYYHYIKEENSDYQVVNLMDEKIYQDFYIIKAKLIEDGMTELSRSTLTEDGAKKEIMIAFDDCTSIKYPNRVFIPLEEKSYGSYNTNTGYGILKTSDNVEDSLTFLYLLNMINIQS